jgi:hypothetical protein
LKSAELADFNVATSAKLLIHTRISTTFSSPRKEPIVMSIYFKNLDLSKIIKKIKKPRRRKLINPFPIKLYQMLQESAQNGKGDIVGWAPGGLSFQVHDSERFVTEVLPFYFNQTKYKSFQRQLSFYGFKRRADGSVDGSYSHKFFIRGNMEMCKKIVREINPKNKEKQAESSDDVTTSFLECARDEKQLPVIQDNAYHRDSISSTNLPPVFDHVDDDLGAFSVFGEEPLNQEQQGIVVVPEEENPVSFVGKAFHLLPLPEDIVMI